MALQWLSNPYRIHQRLMMGCDGDPRLLFRVEERRDGVEILVQSHQAPDWQAAFNGFPVMLAPPEFKPFELRLQAGRRYRFRLIANPTVKRGVNEDGRVTKKRLGLRSEPDQIAWLGRKLEAAGAALEFCQPSGQHLQRSYKAAPEGEGQQTHLAVLFDGVLRAGDPARLEEAVKAGVGPAKGYGFGLLSLAVLNG